jgi:hypothetical protein
VSVKVREIFQEAAGSANLSRSEATALAAMALRKALDLPEPAATSAARDERPAAADVATRPPEPTPTPVAGSSARTRSTTSAPPSASALSSVTRERASTLPPAPRVQDLPPIPTVDGNGKPLPKWKVQMLERERAQQLAAATEAAAKQAKIDELLKK